MEQKKLFVKGKSSLLNKLVFILIFVTSYLISYHTISSGDVNRVLSDISVIEEKDETKIIFIFNQPIKKYSFVKALDGFSANLILENTINDWPPLMMDFDQGIIKRIDSSQQQDFSTKVTIEFRSPVFSQIDLVKNDLVVTLTPMAYKEEIKKKEIQLCKIIDILTEKNKEQTTVIIKTSTQPVIKHFRTSNPDLIVIDFLDTKCEQIRKIIDDTHISFISLMQLLTSPIYVSRLTIGITSSLPFQIISTNSNQIEVVISNKPLEEQKSIIVSPEQLTHEEIDIPIVEKITKKVSNEKRILSNGDFAEGLEFWQRLENGKGKMELKIIKDNMYAHVLEFNRTKAKKTNGILGVSQKLNIDTSKYHSLNINAVVKVIHSELESDELEKGIYPVTIELIYLDKDGKMYAYRHGFQYHKTLHYPQIGQIIPKNKWYSYTSNNLLEVLRPKPDKIMEVKIYGEGWNFTGRVAHIQLIGESVKPELVKVGEEKVHELIKKSEGPKTKLEKESLITNVFFETDIKQVLRDISTQAKIPILADDTVGGVVTVELQDVPLEKALEMVLSSRGYTFKKFDTYYLVGLADPTAPSFSKLTITENIRLNYLQAEDLSTLISSVFLPFIQVNKAKNLVTITASPQIVARIKKDIDEVDIPISQVVIEVLVTELSKEGKKAMGTNWDLKWKDPSSVTFSKKDEKESISYTITSDLTGQALLTFINLLVKDGKAEIKANPRIATLNGQQAKIKISREEFYQLLSGRVGYESTTLKAIESGIILQITPYISQTDEITVKLNSEVGDVAEEGTLQGLPIVNKRVVETMVRVEDGQTIIIGGLTQKRKDKRITVVPVLGSIPGLKFFFKQTRTVSKETEIVIFITPHILKKNEL